MTACFAGFYLCKELLVWMTRKWLGHHTTLGLLLVYPLQGLEETEHNQTTNHPKQPITQKPNNINRQITILSWGSAAHASQRGDWVKANHLRCATTLAPGTRLDRPHRDSRFLCEAEEKAASHQRCSWCPAAQILSRWLEIQYLEIRDWARWQRSSLLVSEDSARQKAPDVAMPVAWNHPKGFLGSNPGLARNTILLISSRSWHTLAAVHLFFCPTITQYHHLSFHYQNQSWSVFD